MPDTASNITATPAEAGSGQPPGSPLGPTQPPYTVLCVDDEPNILSSLRRLFRPCGYRVLVAEGGAQGLEVLRSEPVDLVISDMRMPHMDGAQFLKAVREGWPEVVRILLTGYADISSTIEAVNQGQIYRYVSKPWTDEDMVLTIRQALETRALQREKDRLEALTREQNESLRQLNESLETKVLERTADLQRAHEKLKQSFLTAVKIFSTLMEMRHPVLAGHSRRVAALARSMAIHMGMTNLNVQNVFIAGMLHDIGKIGFPDELLTRAVRTMSPEDLVTYRKHPVDGVTALMALDELAPVTKLVRHHHERFDGQGFPDGLQGHDIPLGARLLAVANDYDSLQIGTFSALRFKPEEARQTLEKDRGKRYDPQALDALVAVTTAAPKPPVRERQLKLSELQPGMVLSREFTRTSGALLLGVDQVLSAKLIERMQVYENSEGVELSVYVKD
jgi:putative nucleotidyltransferase with HDIG domain